MLSIRLFKGATLVAALSNLPLDEAQKFVDYAQLCGYGITLDVED